MAVILLGIVIAGSITWLLRWLHVLKILKGDIYLKEDSSPCIDHPLPSVSILVPARNEEENISQCISSLLKQDYPDFEIIVIDDRSIDKTAQILKGLTALYQDKLKALNVSGLPHGWTGKTHALHEGSKVARGEWLLFTDADTIHNPLSLKSSIAYSLEQDINFLSLYPQSRGKSLGEKITQPLGGSILHLWYPFEYINSPKKKTAFANGQFILIKKECYLDIGGHEGVKSELLEDVAMAEVAKAKGKKIRMGYGFNLFSIRMYRDFGEIWKGWRRIFGVLMKKNKTLGPVSLILMLLFSFIPFALVFNIYILFEGGIWTALYLTSLFEIIFLYLTNAWIYVLCKNNPLWAIFYPIGCIIMFSIILDALVREVFKKPIIWRGTAYHITK